ncbi:TIGR01212 family radical SAM protein [Nitratidesulfovibrio sp. D1]|uniref:TIGR01212 family radical SAM protein n=1 Tax=Nitratidesulfovibrio sp. D1 TaxID=3440151 RepID=UPI003EB84E6C
MENTTARLHLLATYLRLRFGARVQKVPLDAGFSCPNRDGTLSRGGCVFCNPRGSGSGLGEDGLTLEEQWTVWTGRYARTRNAGLFIAYLQSFSNTYGPIDKLRHVLGALPALPGIVGAAVGTRPDCVDDERLDLVAALPLPEVWLELGLQSAHDATLARINRGHGAAASERAVRAAAARGLRVCAHLMAGLPGENARDFLATVDWVNWLPVHGVKFHGLYVCEHTALARQWRAGEYTPLEREEYADLMARALPRLRPEIVVQRLTGDPAGDELLAPDWAGDKRATTARIHELLAERDTWQGKDVAGETPNTPDAPSAPPAWFAVPPHRLPGAAPRLRDTEQARAWEAEYATACAAFAHLRPVEGWRCSCSPPAAKGLSPLGTP